MNKIENFQTVYKKIIIPSLYKKFLYKNIHQVPKLIKIKINQGLGSDAQTKGVIDQSIKEIRAITGQQPIIVQAKKSIANFKVREKMNIGLTVTLRKKKMYCFLEKLIHLTLPQLRDFRGLSIKGFDQTGNYNFGFSEQSVFPELAHENIDKIRGFNITIVTTATTKEEGKALLLGFGFPLTN